MRSTASSVELKSVEGKVLGGRGAASIIFLSLELDLPASFQNAQLCEKTGKVFTFNYEEEHPCAGLELTVFI